MPHSHVLSGRDRHQDPQQRVRFGRRLHRALRGDPERQTALTGRDRDSYPFFGGPTGKRRTAPFARPRHVPVPHDPVPHGPLPQGPLPHGASLRIGLRAMDAVRGAPHPLGLRPAPRCLWTRTTTLRATGTTALRAGRPAAVTGPDTGPNSGPDTERAVRAHRRAGVRDVSLRPCDDDDPVLLMLFHPDAASSV